MLSCQIPKQFDLRSELERQSLFCYETCGHRKSFQIQFWQFFQAFIVDFRRTELVEL